MNILLRYASTSKYNCKSHHHLQNVSTDDIVLVADVNLPHLRWKKGRITKLIKGNNGLAPGSIIGHFCINCK